MFNVTSSYQTETCIVRRKHIRQKTLNYKSTGLVADSSLTWLRGFLGEPL